jgi:mRNA interferase RelE/StbE
MADNAGEAKYSILFARSARKELEALPPPIAVRVLQRIENLEREPRARGSKKLEGSVDLWRVRVGDYRIVYSVNDSKQIVDVIAVRHRRDAYK